jgi:hypothetical protein
MDQDELREIQRNQLRKNIQEEYRTAMEGLTKAFNEAFPKEEKQNVIDMRNFVRRKYKK